MDTYCARLKINVHHTSASMRSTTDHFISNITFARERAIEIHAYLFTLSCIHCTFVDICWMLSKSLQCHVYWSTVTKYFAHHCTEIHHDQEGTHFCSCSCKIQHCLSKCQHTHPDLFHTRSYLSSKDYSQHNIIM